jgi:hypothetical protein
MALLWARDGLAASTNGNDPKAANPLVGASRAPEPSPVKRPEAGALTLGSGEGSYKGCDRGDRRAFSKEEARFRLQRRRIAAFLHGRGNSLAAKAYGHSVEAGGALGS